MLYRTIEYYDNITKKKSSFPLWACLLTIGIIIIIALWLIWSLSRRKKGQDLDFKFY